MRRTRINSSWLVVVASLLMLLAVCGAAVGQSGRRTPKGSGSATPQPTPEPEPTPVAPKTPAQPQISLLVLSDVSQSLYLSVPFPEKVETWVAKRLRDAPALAVMEGESANRSEAIKRAKASKDTFVIFIRLDETGNSPATDRMGTGRANLDDVSIGYSVFAPVTGKSQASGVVYLSQRSTIMGRVRTAPLCYPGVRGNDLILLQASLEVATRIMAALNVSAPPVCS